MGGKHEHYERDPQWSGRRSRTDRLLALLWCCAVHFRFQAVDVWNTLGPFRRPRRFSQSCEVQLPDVSDHRARRQKAAKRASLPLELSATGYLLESGRFHVQHEETHRSTPVLLMSLRMKESLNSEALEAFSLTIDDHYETEQLLTIFGQKSLTLIPPSLTLDHV